MPFPLRFSLPHYITGHRLTCGLNFFLSFDHDWDCFSRKKYAPGGKALSLEKNFAIFP